MDVATRLVVECYGHDRPVDSARRSRLRLQPPHGRVGGTQRLGVAPQLAEHRTEVQERARRVLRLRRLRLHRQRTAQRGQRSRQLQPPRATANAESAPLRGMRVYPQSADWQRGATVGWQQAAAVGQRAEPGLAARGEARCRRREISAEGDRERRITPGVRSCGHWAASLVGALVKAAQVVERHRVQPGAQLRLRCQRALVSGAARRQASLFSAVVKQCQGRENPLLLGSYKPKGFVRVSTRI